MPTQVIYQQQDPTAQLIQKSGDDVASALRQEQAMALTARYYQIMKQNADSETASDFFSRKLQVIKGTQDIKQNILDPLQRAIALKDLLEGSHQADAVQGFKTLGDVGNDVQERLKALTPSDNEGTAAQMQSANYQNTQMDLAMKKRMQDFQLQQMGMGDNQQPQGSAPVSQLQGPLAQQPQDQATAPDTSAASDMKNDWVMTEPGKFVNVGAESYLASRKKQAELQAAQESPDQQIDTAQSMLDNLSQSQKGLEASGGLFGLSGKMGLFKSEATSGEQNPNIASYMRDLDATGSSLWPALYGKPYRQSYQPQLRKLLGDPTNSSKAVLADNLRNVSKLLAVKRQLGSSSMSPDALQRYADSPAGKTLAEQNNKSQSPQFTPEEIQAEIRRRAALRGQR